MVKKGVEQWVNSSTKSLPSRIDTSTSVLILIGYGCMVEKMEGIWTKVDKMVRGWDFIFNCSSFSINALRVSKGCGFCVDPTTCLPLSFC